MEINLLLLREISMFLTSYFSGYLVNYTLQFPPSLFIFFLYSYILFLLMHVCISACVLCVCICGYLLRTQGYFMLPDVGSLILWQSSSALNHMVIFPPRPTPFKVCVCVRCVFGCLHAVTHVEVRERTALGATSTLFGTGAPVGLLFLCDCMCQLPGL